MATTGFWGRIALVAVLPGLAGAQPPDATTPSAPAAPAVAPAAEGPTVLRVGEVMEIALQGNASTGYRWTIDDDASPVLRPAPAAPTRDVAVLGGAQPPGPPPKPGSPTTQRWRFEAAAPGEATLRMRYHRPWETTGTVRRATWQVRVVPADAPAPARP